MYRPLVLVLTQPSTRLFFNCFDIPQIAGSAFYVPVLRSWLVVSALINFQQISECKLTQLYSLPDTGKKADKKRYLFTRPRRKWTCSDENMFYPLHPLECKPSRIKRLHKNASKNLCNPASIILNSGGLLLNILPGLVHINLPESTGFLFDHDSKLATNIVYHKRYWQSPISPICTEIYITEDHLDTQFLIRAKT